MVCREREPFGLFPSGRSRRGGQGRLQPLPSIGVLWPYPDGPEQGWGSCLGVGLCWEERKQKPASLLLPGSIHQNAGT